MNSKSLSAIPYGTLCLLSKPLHLLLFILTNTKPRRTSKALDQSVCWKQEAEKTGWVGRGLRVSSGSDGALQPEVEWLAST